MRVAPDVMKDIEDLHSRIEGYRRDDDNDETKAYHNGWDDALKQVIKLFDDRYAVTDR